MRYETELPAVHLGGATIAALEELLLEDCTDPEIEIKLDHGPVTYRYASSEELRRDVGLPDVVRSFEVTLAAREGRIEVATDAREAELNLSVAGDGEWAETRRRRVESFFRARGATLRTLLERYLALGLTAAVVVAGLAAYYAGFGPAVGMRTPVDALLYGSLAVFAGGLLHPALNAVYPYAAVVLGDRSRGGPPTVRPAD